MKAITLQICDTVVRNSYARSVVFCLPKINCRPDGTGIFTDESYNCNKCNSEPKAYMPWIQGDVIYFQTNFADAHHADIENPTDPFAPTSSISSSTSYRAELQYPGGSSLILAEFSTGALVGWNGENSYQIVKVDTSLSLFDNLDCWELKVSSLDADGNEADYMTTQTFRKVICEGDTVWIKSSYKTFDCFGNYYGEPVAYAGDLILFNNGMRFNGIVVEVGISSAANYDFASNSGNNSSVIFRYNTMEWHPFYQRKLLKNLLDSPSFLIDNKSFRRPAYNIEGGFFKISLEDTCGVSNIC